MVNAFFDTETVVCILFSFLKSVFHYQKKNVNIVSSDIIQYLSHMHSSFQISSAMIVIFLKSKHL